MSNTQFFFTAEEDPAEASYVASDALAGLLARRVATVGFPEGDPFGDALKDALAARGSIFVISRMPSGPETFSEYGELRECDLIIVRQAPVYLLATMAGLGWWYDGLFRDINYLESPPWVRKSSYSEELKLVRRCLRSLGNGASEEELGEMYQLLLLYLTDKLPKKQLDKVIESSEQAVERAHRVFTHEIAPGVVIAELGGTEAPHLGTLITTMASWPGCYIFGISFNDVEGTPVGLGFATRSDLIMRRIGRVLPWGRFGATNGDMPHEALVMSIPRELLEKRLPKLRQRVGSQRRFNHRRLREDEFLRELVTA